MPNPEPGQQALAGRSAIVTGGGSGIGQAIARLFARRGARVAILDVSDASGTVQEIEQGGGMALYLRCDVTRQADVEAAFATVIERFGGLDILVNSAGVAHVGTVEQTSEADLDRVYAVNVKGVYNCLRSGVRAMKQSGGAILNIASVASTMTYSVARDYLANGIRCNAVAPARVHTPFVDGFLARSYPGREREMFEQLSRSQPIGRMGKPDEIAELALFLCSDSAAFITGSNYAIDGGFVSLKM
jgi:2-keto-3-deoxy-L-fuconate dehydrogenase